ncbi:MULTISPECIES: HNH endonuclease [Micromonospora]|uniref:HNH endonuclease n=1 Tax=unclassified Micromonospora TaxID=2617518 RepID=UPI001E56726B|nr:HNH endonuclease [Micromonospora sp. NBRC 110038]
MTLHGRNGHQAFVQRGEQLPQLVLQLRGGPSMRGPQHYAHSVEQGIRLADIAVELGADLAVLRQLYPGGVARFWGSTPTNQVNNYKARALRDRQVGDDVLFYADTVFYARARILHLLHNPAAAKRIWGADDDGRTWEHMMALGDVERLERPVLAEPILRRLGLSVPLRSLTLVDADGYATILPLLAAAGVTPRTTVGGARRKMTRKRLVKALKRLADACGEHSADQAARVLSVSVLWSIGQIASAESHPGEPQDPGSGLESILARYGATGASQPGAVEQVRNLQHSKLWGIVRSEALWEADSSAFHAGRGLSAGAVSPVRFTPAVTGLLGEPENRGSAVGLLLDALPADIDRAALLADIGLAGYDSASGVLDGEAAGSDAGHPGPARRRTVRTDRIIRSSVYAETVKRLHGHHCQVCATRLATRYGFYSEAAHIKGLGRPHEGPDLLENLLCLCPNHHVQFDKFAIYVDSEFVVRWTVDGEKIGKLRLHPGHRIGPDFLQHHRRFCGRAD